MSEATSTPQNRGFCGGPDDILKVVAPAIKKILERAAKGKKIGSQGLSFLLLYNMSSRISHLNGEIAGLCQEMAGFRQDIKPLIEAVAELIKRSKQTNLESSSQKPEFSSQKSGFRIEKSTDYWLLTPFQILCLGFLIFSFCILISFLLC